MEFLTITNILLAIIVIVSIKGFNDEGFREELIFSPFSAVQNKKWWLFITHGFVHADAMHLFFNGFVFYNFGNFVEVLLKMQFGSVLGIISYLVLFIGGLVAATLPSVIKHKDNPIYRSLGASGTVSAVLFVFIIYMPLTPLRLFLIPIDIPAIIVGVGYIAYESYANKNQRTNIAHDAHLAGAVFGLVWVLFTNPSQYLELVNTIKNAIF